MTTTAELVATPSAGTAVKVGFGERTLTTQAETSSSAIAAQQTAMVQAAFIMAERRPRSFDQVRVVMLQTCLRPGFAAAARYKKPVGKEYDESTGKWVPKFAEGLSIRFAEEAARVMTNLKMDSYTLYDDPTKKILKFVVLDLESNAEWSKTVTIEKTTEKKKLSKGQTPIRTRTNSYGDPVFIVEATAEEVDKKEGAAASKGWRDGILKLMPADIKEECMRRTLEVTQNRDASDPAAAKKAVMDGFATIGVKPVNLQEYLGHELDIISPAELDELRGLYTAIHDGEISWAAVIQERRELREEQDREAEKKEGKAAAAAGGPSKVEAAVKAAKEKREAAKAAARGASAAPPAEVTPPPPQAEFVMPTPKARKALIDACAEARVMLADIVKKFGKATIDELSADQVEEGMRMVEMVTVEVREPGSED